MDEQSRKEWLDFASIGEMIISTSTNTNTTGYTIDDIETALSNPYRNHQNLRAISDYFYYNNGIYRNIINAYTSLATLDHMILPSSKTVTKMADKSYQTYFDKVKNYIDTIGIKPTTRTILKSIARYGGYVGYERNNGNEFTLQTLPIDYCRVKYKVGHDFQVEFNFKYFDKFFNKEDLDLAWLAYPPEFQSLYQTYKSGSKGSRTPEWQPLDIKKTFCVVHDDDEPFFIPIFSGMFEALLNNEDYKDLIKTGEELEVSKLVVQKIPTDKDGNIQIPKELVVMLHQALKQALPTGVNGLTTPLEIRDVPFTNRTTTKEELLAKAERGAFVSGGWSADLFASSAGHTGLNMNVEVVTSHIYMHLEKIEAMFSRKFKNVANTKNYEFNLRFYRTTNVNVQDNFDRAYKLVEVGGAVTPLITLLGVNPEDYATLLQIEDLMGIKDLFAPLQSIHTTSGSTDAGRVPLPESKLTDKGQQTRDLGSNQN
jgi:hypothetical protein